MKKSIDKPPVLGEIPIQNLGSYFEIDDEGYVINPASKEKIQEEWKPVLNDVVSKYRQRYGDKLVSVFVRGSVAKGQAVAGVSDVDSFAYVDLAKDEISHDWTEAAEKELMEKHPFAQGIEFSVDPVSDAADDRIMLVQSVCVYGTSPLVEEPKLKPGREMVVHALNLQNRLNWLTNKLNKIEDDEEEMKRACLWLSKGLLRSGFELTMERSHAYTRDLYPCYETFAKYYPEKEPEMREALHLALNPVAERKVLERLMDGLGTWIREEAKAVYSEGAEQHD